MGASLTAHIFTTVQVKMPEHQHDPSICPHKQCNCMITTRKNSITSHIGRAAKWKVRPGKELKFWSFDGKAWSWKNEHLKACLNRCNITQHCWKQHVGKCWIVLEALVFKRSQHHATCWIITRTHVIVCDRWALGKRYPIDILISRNHF